jgi:Ca-activated chloride channel family protein
MFRFADPNWLNFLWIIPVLLLVLFSFESRAFKKFETYYGPRVSNFLTSTVSIKKRKLKIFLKLLALTFFIIALARPQTGHGTQTIKSEGVELMILFDVSNSMLAEDVKPSRLAFAKSEMIKLSEMLTGDKIGLIAFAGSAILESPLTTDKSALGMYIEGLSPKSVENQGTEFKRALLEAEKAFERGGVDPDEGVKITKVVVIASDGEDQEPGALETAQKLAQKGIKIFTIAFGTERGAPIPNRDEFGNLRSYKRDKQYKDILTRVDDSVLRSIAQAGGGSFYHATFGGNEMKAVREDINKLEKALFDSQTSATYDEKFQIFLWIGLFFGLLDLLLSEKKAIDKIWRGRFEARPN